MSERNHSASKVVSMSQFAGRLDSRATELVRKVQDLTLKVLEQLLGAMLSKADDALFDLANRADSNSSQQLYFDAMRDIRLKRNSIESGFTRAVIGSFDNFISGSPTASADSDQAPYWGGDLSLDLVEVEDMEELIAIKNMSARAERDCYQGNYETAVRLETISKRNGIHESNHPLSPSAVARAFGDTISPLELDIKVKLIIYKLFEKNVMNGIGLLYKEANSLLIKEGVLPTIKHEVRRNRNSAIRRPQPPSNDLPWSESDPDGLVPHVGGGAYGGGLFIGHPGFGTVVGKGADLVGVLSALQGYVVENGYPGDLTPSEIGGQLLQMSRQLGPNGSHTNSRANDEKTINMVSMIFDYILEDINIPDAIKALIARLQIPVLKVALLDRDFFSRNQHPARKLLNEIARASIGWDADNKALQGKVAHIVEAILADFDDNPEIFAEFRQDFLEFLHAEEERARVFEDRTKKTAEGKERVEFVKRRTEAWIEMWVSRDDVPEFVKEFLRNTWKNTLLITMHSHGEDSKEWASRIKTVNNLLWSIYPKKNPNAAKLLLELLPGILDEVRDGMELASAHPNTVKSFFDKLANLHAKTVNGGIDRIPCPDRNAAEPEETETCGINGRGQTGDVQSASAVREAAPGKAEDLTDSLAEGTEQVGLRLVGEIPILHDVVEEIVLGALGVEGTAAKEEYRDEYMEMAEQLESGTWVEFTSEDGESTRAKLSWKSPMTSCCLFVNRKGMKVCEKTTAGLAAELRSGRANLLEDAPLLDRAINAFWRRGETQSADAPGASSNADSNPTNN